LAIILIIAGFNISKSISRSSKEHADAVRAVQQFDRKVQDVQSPLSSVLSATTKTTADFAAGKLPKDEYLKQVDSWLAQFRSSDTDLRKRKIATTMPRLEEARAMFVDGVIVFIDAAKSFQLAGTAADPAIRDQAIKQGNNLISHGTTLVFTGQRILQELKQENGLVKATPGAPGASPEPDVSPAPPAIQLPTEEAPVPGTAAGGVPGGVPGQQQAPQ